MKNKKTLIFSSFSDAEGNYIYIFLKGYGKFILENNMNIGLLQVRITHWENILDKVSNGLMVETKKEAIYIEPPLNVA